MKNRWDDQQYQGYQDSDLATRVYSSRLLGAEPDLVLHGGGNTSVKVTEANIFGETEQRIYVKGSGWDLKTIEQAGFAGLELNSVERLVQLESLSDSQMVQQLKAAMVNPQAPSPSVETILHAIMPFKYVDHTHADAVVAVSNTPGGAERLQQIYGDSVLILPYVMPGFILSKQIHQATKNKDWSEIRAIILMHHGVFTFANDAKQSYDCMIEVVSQAEQYLEEMTTSQPQATGAYQPQYQDYLTIAHARKISSKLMKKAAIVRWQTDPASVGFSQIAEVENMAGGPLTPDHTLHTKRLPVILENCNESEFENYSQQYQRYFQQHQNNHQMLDTSPRYGIWKNKGILLFGTDVKKINIIGDIVAHTQKAIQWGEKLGAWQALPEKDIFELEYWELEQAKLKKPALDKPFAGKIALITGAASGIGLATTQGFVEAGACVIALDVNADVEEIFGAESASVLPLLCDITDRQQVRACIEKGIKHFGGLDILVSNAGVFPESQEIEKIEDELFSKTLNINFVGQHAVMQEALPFLKHGIDASVVIVASKNVPAPGPGVAAYSSAKAALTQYARVAAMEWAKHGIRVNTLHPNGVFDTAIWSPEILGQRAAQYQISVDQYKTNNLLNTEINSHDVAKLILTLAGPQFAKTTGAQIPIDGGNDRVI